MAGKDGDKTLRRIIWMLLSLSLLAERASTACWPVRCLVLWILRPAEAVACGFVQELTQAPLGFIDLSDFPDDNSPAAALCLAMRFTALAAMLQYLLDQPQPFEGNTRQAHAAAGVRLVVRHLTEKAPIGLPGSRAPPLTVLPDISPRKDGERAAFICAFANYQRLAKPLAPSSFSPFFHGEKMPAGR